MQTVRQAHETAAAAASLLGGLPGVPWRVPGERTSCTHKKAQIKNMSATHGRLLDLYMLTYAQADMESG